MCYGRYDAIQRRELMNWLVYLSGYFVGWIFFNSLTQTESDTVWARVISWTMLWVWICWRFIA